MERKNKKKLTFCLSLFFILTFGLLLSLIFSEKIEKKLGLKPQGVSKLTNYEFKVDFINVGQGASCLISLPNNEKMLIDTGTNSSEKKLVNFLEKQKIEVIDYLVFTHSDNDHTGGADAILDNFQVKTIYRPFILADNNKYPNCDPLLFYEEELGTDENGKSLVTVVEGTDYAKCIDLIYKETYTINNQQKSSKVWVISDGLFISAGSSVIKFWWPPVLSGQEPIDQKTQDSGLTYGNVTQKCSSTNDYSPIISISYLSVNMVLTGDASSSVERDFLETLNDNEKVLFQNSEVYVAGHHGSNSSSCEAFLSLIMPKYIVIQCGESSTHPHVDFFFFFKEIWEKNNKSGVILTTNENGDITFYYNSSDMKNIESAVYYTGTADSVVTSWWQIVVCIIVVLAVFLLIPLIPKKKRNK